MKIEYVAYLGSIFLSAFVLWQYLRGQKQKEAIAESSQKLTDLIREKDFLRQNLESQKKNLENWVSEYAKLKKDSDSLRESVADLRSQIAAKDKEHLAAIPKQRQDAVDKARSVLKGKITEEITPLLPDFPYAFGDCRFSGSPLDFVVYKGMSDGNVTEIIFLDVKTGEAKLNQVQRQIRKCVLDKQVKFVTFTPESAKTKTQ